MRRLESRGKESEYIILHDFLRSIQWRLEIDEQVDKTNVVSQVRHVSFSGLTCFVEKVRVTRKRNRTYNPARFFALDSMAFGD